MDTEIYEDETFENVDYSQKKLSPREFTACAFTNCNFQKSDLTNDNFIDCSFTGCDFSLAILSNTGIKNCNFSACKLLGIDFSRCSDFLFAASFQNCHLDYSSFYKKKMKKTTFSDCSLKEVDFAETDLSASLFKNCDLLNATFMQTILEKADFHTAINYSIDPELNKMKKAKFSYLGIAGLLNKYDIDIEFE